MYCFRGALPDRLTLDPALPGRVPQKVYIKLFHLLSSRLKFFPVTLLFLTAFRKCLDIYRVENSAILYEVKLLENYKQTRVYYIGTGVETEFVV